MNVSSLLSGLSNPRVTMSYKSPLEQYSWTSIASVLLTRKLQEANVRKNECQMLSSSAQTKKKSSQHSHETIAGRHWIHGTTAWLWPRLARPWLPRDNWRTKGRYVVVRSASKEMVIGANKLNKEFHVDSLPPSSTHLVLLSRAKWTVAQEPTPSACKSWNEGVLGTSAISVDKSSSFLRP